MTITEGNVSRVDSDLWPQIQLDVSVSPGNSGGPVVNHEGAVVGVLVAKDTQAEGLAYAVRSDFVAPAVSGAAPIEIFQAVSCGSTSGGVLQEDASVSLTYFDVTLADHRLTSDLWAVEVTVCYQRAHPDAREDGDCCTDR